MRHWPVGVTSLRLVREPIILAVPKCHRLARLRAVPLAVIADEPFIMTHFTVEKGRDFAASKVLE
jgi:hypothetical protein